MTAAALGSVGDLPGRVGPVVVFLLAITVTAEIAEIAGVFDVAGHWVAHLGRHRVWLLWLAFAGLATVCTTVLSLDTTAVLLTPVGLAVARQIGASPVPFALTTLWLANTGSLLLPVSNLTNLLALHRFATLGVDHVDYIAMAAVPALVAVLVTLACVAVLRRRELHGSYAVAPPPDPHDQVLLRVAGAACLAVGPLFAVGLPPAVVSTAAAVVLVVTVVIRDRSILRRVSVPWRMAVGFVAVAALVTWLEGHGLSRLLGSAVGDGGSLLALLRVAGVGGLAANVVNNLPAYLGLEPAADQSAQRLFALLIGVNVMPLVTPWASLATLLWLQRCRAAGVRFLPVRLAAAGLVCALLAAGAAVLALSLVG